MPNHCETDFTIYGRTEQVKALMAKHVTEDGTLDCDSVIPYPDEYKELDRLAAEWQQHLLLRKYDGFNSGGYEWCYANWGTKWGTYSGRAITEIVHDNDMLEVQLSFESAWSPPTPVFDKLAEMYPSISFRAESFERGAAYQMLQEWKEGHKVTDREDRYDGPRGG